MIYLGAEHIVCPLGASAFEVFDNARYGNISIRQHHEPTISRDRFVASRFETRYTAEQLAVESLHASMQLISHPLDGRTLFILSTTKGEIDQLDNERGRLGVLMNSIIAQCGLQPHASLVVSNACISGLLAVITAADLIHNGRYDHAVICGVDLVSRFTVSGFQALYALDDQPCRPWDVDRKGINLGEGASSVVLSRDSTVFDRPFTFLAGACANDANHISGPSRTGEGLHRAIERTVRASGKNRRDIGQVSAHGTATRYNDDMESIAFARSDLADKPIHSYKGYFGHTLGAAGLIELSLLMESVRHETILPSAGLQQAGTSKSINVTDQVQHASTPLVLKTASGFGGCNAAALIAYEN